MKKMLLAFQFLTVVPVRVGGDIADRDVAGSAVFFPLVGAFQGLLTAAAAALMLRVFPPDVAAGFSLVVLTLSNGGFDLDGLADTADALAIKPSGDEAADRAKRLTVMKDSAVGTMGVIALTMTLLLKYLLIRLLLAEAPLQAACAILFLTPAVARWLTVPVMYHGTPARQDGLGKIFIEHVGAGSVVVSTGFVFLLYFSAHLMCAERISAAGVVARCVLSLAVLYSFGLAAVSFFRRRFGGLTGDHFGALTEITEIFFLLAGYAWLPRSI